MTKVTYYLTDEEIETIKSLSKEKNISQGKVLSEALNHYLLTLNHEKSKKEKLQSEIKAIKSITNQVQQNQLMMIEMLNVICLIQDFCSYVSTDEQQSQPLIGALAFVKSKVESDYIKNINAKKYQQNNEVGDEDE